MLGAQFSSEVIFAGIGLNNFDKIGMWYALESLANRMFEVPVTGIDISDRNIKFIRFRRRGKKLAVDAYGSADIGEGVVIGGEIKNHDALTEALRKLPLGGRFNAPFVAVSLPEEKGFVRTIQVPHAKTGEMLKNSLQWELEGNIPLPPEEIYFDYEIVGESRTPDHVNVVTVAFPRSIVDAYVEVLSRAGMRVVALELELQSIARALTDWENLSDPIIIFDIGASRTSLVLTQHGSLSFTSTVPISGEGLSQAIARALGVNKEEAETIKKTVGLRLDQYDGKVFSALQPILLSLVEELEKHINYYHDHLSMRDHAGVDVRKIVCTGGDASLIGLDAYLAKALHKPVAIGDPFLSLSHLMKNEHPPLPKNVSLQFSTAVGLALRDIDL